MAQHAGIHIQTISSFEKDIKIPSLKTLKAILTAVELAGIECLSNGGIQPLQTQVRVFQGKEGFSLFRQDMIGEVKAGIRDLCVNNVNEKFFEKWGRGNINNEYYSYMESVNDLRFRILVKGPNYYKADVKYADYKWLPDKLFGDISQYIYADKLTLLSFQNEKFYAYQIKDRNIASFYQKEFDRLWLKAKRAL